MSEKDMKLGGAAAQRFAAKPGSISESVGIGVVEGSGSGSGSSGGGAYANDTSGVYKTSDDVRKYYYALDEKQKHQEQEQEPTDEQKEPQDYQHRPAGPQDEQQSALLLPLSSSRNDYYSAATRTSAPGAPETTPGTSCSSSLPPLWADRQKERDIQARQYGVFSSKNNDSIPAAPAMSATMTSSSSSAADHNYESTIIRSSSSSCSSSPRLFSAEVALVQVATNTLETLAKTLLLLASKKEERTGGTTSSSGSSSSIPLKEKEAFAQAIRHAMEAMSKC